MLKRAGMDITRVKSSFRIPFNDRTSLNNLASLTILNTRKIVGETPCFLDADESSRIPEGVKTTNYQ